MLHAALPSSQPALLSSTSPSLLPPCPATNATVLHRPFSSALSVVCCCTLLLAHPVGTTSSAVPSRANAISPSLTPASGSWSRPRQCLQRVPPPRESTHRLLPVPKKQHICLLPTPTPSAKLTPGKRNKLLLLRGSRGMAEGGRSRGRLQLCLRPERVPPPEGAQARAWGRSSRRSRRPDSLPEASPAPRCLQAALPRRGGQRAAARAGRSAQPPQSPEGRTWGSRASAGWGQGEGRSRGAPECPCLEGPPQLLRGQPGPALRHRDPQPCPAR